MKPAAFEYDDPRTVDEALGLLADHGDECKVIAGGQSLVPLMNFRLARPGRLVDINGVEALAHIIRDEGRLVIGAMTRHADVERSTTVAKGWPLLAEAIVWVGHPQIRNRGTIGGSVAHADPAAELPAVFAAMDATFHVRSKQGRRAVGWKDFFRSEFTTSIAPDELVMDIEIPEQDPSAGTAFVEFARRHGDFALGGAAVTLKLGRGGVCERAAIALVAAGPKPVRAEAAEALLTGAIVDAQSIHTASERAVEGLQPTGDLHGSTEYRLKLLRVMVQRALATAAERATTKAS
jgi:CO/xanthine dehydrogenase FAD-binding subunit